MSLLPTPAHTMPALNHRVSDSSVGSTPPVGMIDVHGQGPFTASTNEGPPTSAPGKIFTISQPSSSAWPISETVPQPGEYGTFRRLQARATSGLRSGPTTKFAPLLM